MAALPVGITATNLEGYLLEVLREFQEAETAWVAEGLELDPPQSRTRRLQVSVNLLNQTVSISATLPITVLDSPGGFGFTAQEYMLDT